jgi:hypothetical protein
MENLNMTTNMVLLIVSVLLIAAAMFSYFGYLRIASILYVRLVEQPEPPKPGELKLSPYRISRIWNRYQKQDLYYIYKGNTIHVDRRFETAEQAQTSLNELEQLEGYTHTKVV